MKAVRFLRRIDSRTSFRLALLSAAMILISGQSATLATLAIAPLALATVAVLFSLWSRFASPMQKPRGLKARLRGWPWTQVQRLD